MFPLIKLINGQETDGARGANFHYGTSKVQLAHALVPGEGAGM